MKKRVLAIAMSLAMTLSLLPVSALAADNNEAAIGNEEYETLGSAIENVGDGQTITVLTDSLTATSITVNEDKDFILDLNGATLTLSDRIVVTDQDAYYDAEKNPQASTYAGILNEGKLTIENGTITSSANACLIINRGQLTLEDDVDLTKSGEGNAIDNLGGTVVSSADISLTNSDCTAIVTYGGNLTINDGNITADYGISVFNRGYDNESVGAEVEINSGTISAGDYALSTNNVRSGGQSPSNVTINSGSLKSERRTVIYWPSAGTLKIGKIGSEDSDILLETDAGSAVEVCSGTLIVNSGTFKGSDSSDTLNESSLMAQMYRKNSGCAGVGDGITIIARRAAGYDTAALNVTINGGEFESSDNYAVRYFDCNQIGGAEQIDQDVNVTIAGGIFTGGTGVSAVDAELIAESEQKFITGGTFSSNVSAYVPENYECVENEGEDTYTVKKMEAKLVVKPGTDASGNISATLEGNYSSSGTQIDKPETGAGSETPETTTDHVEIDLTTNTTEDETGSTTLNITQATASSLSDASSLKVTTNEGTVELDNDALEKVGEANGTVSITVTKNSTESETNVAASYTVEVKSGSTDLLPDGESDNGTITLTLPVPAASQGTTLYVWYAVEQTGGSVMYVNRVATYNANGTDVTFTVGHLSRYDLLSADPNTTAVASITNDGGTQYYESLGDAISKVGENETITLIKDIPDAVGIAVSSGKKFTVDFNGFTYTLTGPGAGSTNTETNGFQLLRDSTITFKNGTIRIAENSNNIKRIIQNYADLALENMQIYAQNQVGGEDYALSFNNGNITFKGSTSVYTTSDDTIAFDVCKFSNYPSTNVTFDNSYTGTINGQIVYDSPNAGTHSLTIKGNGQFGGISKTAGSAETPSITVTGGTFANSVADIAKTPTYEVDKNAGSYPYSYTNNYAEAIENAGPGGEVSIADKTGSTSVYKVTFVYGDNRNNTTSEVVSGTTVTLPSASRTGYTFNGWRSSADNDLHKAGTSVAITADTTFTANWTRNQTDRPSSGSSGSSSSDSGDYLITVDRVSGGRVTVQPGRADRGDTVTITVYPNDGYELDELVVTDSRGNEIDLDARSATRFTFTMPGGKVTVEASFVREGGQPQVPQTTFADVPASAWYYNAVEYVYENGLMSGVSGGRFAPDDTLTRAMLVQTLYAMEGRPASASAGFADVASGDWYASAVNWAAANGVVSGVSETGFGPNNALTREQLALILYRFAQYKGYDVTGTSDLAAYADGSSVSSWAAEAMGWAVDAGLISGVGGNQIAPTGTASRAQVAQILMNFCENVAR